MQRGRDLDERDTKNAPPVTLINETMAKRFFKTGNPVGRRISVQEMVYGVLIMIVVAVYGRERKIRDRV